MQLLDVGGSPKLLIGRLERLMSKVFFTKVAGWRVSQDEEQMNSGSIRITRLVLLELRRDC